MADDRSSKLLRCSLTKSANASGLTPQNQISVQQFKGRQITRQQEKPNTSIDLRHPQLVHLYSSENGTNNKLNGVGDAPGPDVTVSPPIRSSRPQMARRGGHFQFFNVRGSSRHQTVSDVGESTADEAGDSGHLQSGPNHNPQSGAAPYVCPASGVSPESARNPINKVSCSIGHTDVIDVTSFAQSDLNFRNLSMAEANNTNLDVSNTPSTIIHLKMVAPSSGREESEAIVAATPTKSRGKETTCSTMPSCIPEENLEGRHSTNFVNPDPLSDQHVDGRAAKRKSRGVSDCDSSSDDDLPLIMHCKRSRKIAAEQENLRNGKPVHDTKRTYEKGITAQHGSGSAVGRASDPQNTMEKHGIVYEESNGGDTAAAGSGREGLEPWKKSVQTRHSQGSSSWQQHLEEYERNNFAMRSATDGKTAATGRKVTLPGKNPSDSASPRNSKRPANQVKKVLPIASTRKTHVLRCLRPGPVSLKRKQMKEFGVNPRMMSQVLKQLTERRSSVGRTSKSFLCNSHQNYYDGCLVFRLTNCLPAKERVVVHVPMMNVDDLDPVGTEALVLWRMSCGEVDELQKQVKQEMEHKRTEHIMPVVLQMSYEQIETAYEQVKKDMKTYEITEKDSDVEEDEEEEDEEDKGKYDDMEDESKDKEEDEDRVKSKRNEEGMEELENDTDENLHVRSYEIIVHDESSKTISCETVKYLEWRKKHSSCENGESDALRKEAENPVAFETGVENDPPIDSPNTVKHADASVEQTSYSRSRPKRHAVDYSPSAFAPIRLMEGRRLGGKVATPAKVQSKKKTVNDACQGRVSLTSAHDIPGDGDIQSGVTGGQNNRKSKSSEEARKNKGSTKAERRSSGHQKLPKAHQKESAHDITSKNALDTILPSCEPSVRDDNPNKADIESDDEVPVILDVSDMPLSPAVSSPAMPEQPPVLCEHNNCLEKQTVPSAYDVVRNEYIRLRDLTRAGAADSDAVGSSDVLVSGACDVDDCDVEMFRSDGKLHRDETEHVPLLSDERFIDEQTLSRESSDLSQTQPEACTPTQNAANGGCSTNMPSLQPHCGDTLGTAAEELMAPPDLGLPIECLNSQQYPASPILPPDLQVEAGKMNDGGDVIAGKDRFRFNSDSRSIGGGGDAAALCDSMH